MIEKHSLNTLEYDKIISRLSVMALTTGGKKICEELKPLADFDEIRDNLDATSDFVDYLILNPELPLHGLKDIRPLLKKSKNEMIPEIKELVDLIYFLEVLEKINKIPQNTEKQGQYLFFEQLTYIETLPNLLNRLKQCVNSNQEIDDRASSELYDIRRNINRAQTNIKTQLNRIISSKTQALQDAIITIRNDRYVVPVKSENRSEIPGIVHDMSGSGATVFIEPLAVVELNNKIRELEIAEREEVYKILLELNQRIKEVSIYLKYDAELLEQLDFIQAKAKLSIEMRAIQPILNQEGRVVLYDARHPLIPDNEVVPIYFELGTDFNTLIITGPNTGGKTVTLKTCGLFVLMAMSGLHIPAKEKSEISIFNQVLADIGDEQSIEQNLSTFSSHLKQIIQILNIADKDTLVLTDELGAGTDPSEGAALAIAILDYLRQKGCHTVATTHYRELKGYALNTEKVNNACCEFDEENLKPTYRLLIGIPGVSNAFKISEKLGLKPEIISAAENLISDENTKFEELVSAIEKSHQHAEVMTNEIASLKRESKLLQEQLEKEKEQIAISKNKLITDARQEADQIIQKTQNDVSKILDSLREEIKEAQSSSEKQNAQKSAREANRQLSEKAKINREKIAKHKYDHKTKKLTIDNLMIDEYYHSDLYNIDGQISEILQDKKEVVLKSGVLTVNVPINSLSYISQDKQNKKNQYSKQSKTEKRQTQKIINERKNIMNTEIKLLGLTVPDALMQLDQFIDDAVLANISLVRIVHGKGTGALRQAVHNSLKKDKRIKSFKLAEIGEGDTGVTIAEL